MLSGIYKEKRKLLQQALRLQRITRVPGRDQSLSDRLALVILKWLGPQVTTDRSGGEDLWIPHNLFYFFGILGDTSVAELRRIELRRLLIGVRNRHREEFARCLVEMPDDIRTFVIDFSTPR